MSRRITSAGKAVEPFDSRWALSPVEYRQHYAHIPFDEADERALRSVQDRALAVACDGSAATAAGPAAPRLPQAKAMPVRRSAAKQAGRKKPVIRP